MKHHVSLMCAGLSGGRGDRTVFAGVSLSAAPGDAIVFQGANGAGKSTLLRIIAGLTPSKTGRVQFEMAIGDQDTENNKDNLQSPIITPSEATCLLSHENAIKAALSVRDNLRFWRDLYLADRDDAIIRDVASRLSLTTMLEQSARTLSAGQRRRLALARLLLSGRACWLLDEPTAAMDSASARTVETIIEEHCENGGIALIATHEPLHLIASKTFLLSPGAEGDSA